MRIFRVFGSHNFVFIEHCREIFSFAAPNIVENCSKEKNKKKKQEKNQNVKPEKRLSWIRFKIKNKVN